MARRFWLLKSDPGTFGWTDLEKAKGRRTVWDGVRNYQARNTLRDDVQRGDGVLFYHSGPEKAVVGTCTVTRAGFPDPKDTAWTAIEIELEAKFATPVVLDEMRKIPRLSNMVLLKRGSRLSVQPVSEGEWTIVLKMGQGLIVRDGRPADAPFVVELGASAFARFGDYGPIMQEFLASPQVVSFVAESAGKPVGFALVESFEAHRGIADLVAIAVDSRHRRHGAGRALLRSVIASREDRGEPSLLILTVADDNAAAITLFRAFGFEMVPGTAGRYAGGQTSRRMVKPVVPRRDGTS